MHPVKLQPPAPPGPGARPNLDELRTLQQGPHEFLLHVARQYGGLVRYPVGPLAVYLVTAPDGVRHILQDNNRAYDKATFQYKLLGSITGNGLLTSDGEFWLRQRRLSAPAFHRTRIAGFDRLMTDLIIAMLRRWDAAAAGGQPLDVAAEMMHVALQIVARAMLGVETRVEADELAQATLVVLDHIVGRARSFGLAPTFLPTPGNRRYQAALRTLDRACYEAIARCRAAPADDLLSMLMAAGEDTGERMTDRQLRDEVMTVLIAGHETVASALAWTWHLLGQHPNVEAQLHAEVDAVLGGRVPTAADLPRLVLADRIFSEAMRLYPPAWIISRRALADDDIDGCRIPQNALVVTSPYVTHRLEAYWPEPDAFRPDRFTPEQTAARPRYAYYPFGGGPRLCIGNHFAQVEAVLLIALVAQRFSLRPATETPITVEPGVTLRPRHGLPMRIHPRAKVTDAAARPAETA